MLCASHLHMLAVLQVLMEGMNNMCREYNTIWGLGLEMPCHHHPSLKCVQFVTPSLRYDFTLGPSSS